MKGVSYADALDGNLMTGALRGMFGQMPLTLTRA